MAWPSITVAAEQDGADEIRRRDDGRHAEQQGHRGVLVHVVGERDQHGHADDPVEAGQHTDRKPDDDPDQQNAETCRFQQQGQGMPSHRCHINRHSSVPRPRGLYMTVRSRRALLVSSKRVRSVKPLGLLVLALLLARMERSAIRERLHRWRKRRSRITLCSIWAPNFTTIMTVITRTSP